jgi:protoporphyrinogen oxidase
VVVVERAQAVGGLARTFRYGNSFFDVGPHRFHTGDRAIAKLVAEVVGGDLLSIDRASAVHAFGGFHEWPLRARVLATLPPSLIFRCATDLLRAERPPGESFEAEIVARYGRTLYATFFAPYTRAFLDCEPSDVHRDWARAGIDRAVIDPRVRAGGLGDLLRTALSGRVRTTFGYPRTGIGAFADRLARSASAAGAKILLGRAVESLEATGDHVTAVFAGAERIACDGVIWTGAIDHLLRLLAVRGITLEFRSTVLVNIEVRARPRLSYQWVYFGGAEPFVRLSFPTAFSPDAAPSGASGVCAEVMCRDGDERWEAPSRCAEDVLRELGRQGLVRDSDIEAVHVERVADTYPVYRLGYREQLRRALEEVGRWANLVVAGRSGRFWYNNMDHSIGHGLAIARQLAGNGRLGGLEIGDREFWNRG